MQQYNVVDLFSGAGGLSLGFTQTGRFNIVAAAENNPNARKTYRRNHKNTRLYSDVRTIDYSELLKSVGTVDVVIGGPPCQGFSNANRQHSTIVSMNNGLVKEYVRAICELKPKAFVMENVAMLKSNLHRFFVNESDLLDVYVMGMPQQEDRILLLDSADSFQDYDIKSFASDPSNIGKYDWDEKLYAIINVLYRFRINQSKFDLTLKKHQKPLMKGLTILSESRNAVNSNPLAEIDLKMINSVNEYIKNSSSTDFYEVVSAIERAVLLQRMLKRMKEIYSNSIHVYSYEIDKGDLVAVVKSYSVLDYIKGILGQDPFNYRLYPNVLNAIHYGAPQNRERFIIVGLSKEFSGEFLKPTIKFTPDNYRTVREAISDLQDVPVFTDLTDKPIELNSKTNLSDLAKKLRGSFLYNHIATATGDTAMARFKALKAGQNFHDLDDSLKTTYSNADRTQNTIYKRLEYDAPSGTVVNVRKSMWIHPELDRAISIREAARLQTFPDSFIFEGTKDSQYQQVGNAVPPILANAVAESLIPILDTNIRDVNIY